MSLALRIKAGSRAPRIAATSELCGDCPLSVRRLITTNSLRGSFSNHLRSGFSKLLRSGL